MRPAPVSSDDGEEVQLAAEPAMVAPLGLFELLEMRVQLFLGEERVPVDALHLRVALVALPVRLRRRFLELDRLDLPRRREGAARGRSR